MRVYPATLTLTDAYDTITIRPEAPAGTDPITCTRWDLGAPEMRETVTPRTTSDGTLDSTAYTAARTVTIDLVIRGDENDITDGQSAYKYADRLTAMTHPTRRPTLQISRRNPESYGDIWELGLRGTPFSIAYGRRAAALLELQLGFVAPLGLLEGPWREATATAIAAVGTPVGVTFPITFPISWGNATASSPSATCDVGGTAPISPVVYIYGPSVDPVVRTDDGEKFTFTGLNLASGQFVQIGMGEGTVTIGGNPDASIHHLVDFTASTFWRWNPGTHRVRLDAAGGRVTVQWRERRLTI